MDDIVAEADNRRRNKRYCMLGEWLEGAKPEDRADVLAAYADRTISSSAIAEVLHRRYGVTLVDQIRIHRREACKTCPPGYLNG